MFGHNGSLVALLKRRWGQVRERRPPSRARQSESDGIHLARRLGRAWNMRAEQPFALAELAVHRSDSRRAASSPWADSRT